MKTCLKKVTHIVTLIDKTFDHAVSVESGVDNAYVNIVQDRWGGGGGAEKQACNMRTNGEGWQ